MANSGNNTVVVQSRAQLPAPAYHLYTPGFSCAQADTLSDPVEFAKNLTEPSNNDHIAVVVSEILREMIGL